MDQFFKSFISIIKTKIKTFIIELNKERLKEDTQNSCYSSNGKSKQKNML